MSLNHLRPDFGAKGLCCLVAVVGDTTAAPEGLHATDILPHSSQAMLL